MSMMEFLTETIAGIVILVIIGIVFIIALILSMWKKVPQDRAAVVTGLRKRIITGGGGLVIPVFERIDYISLENMQLTVRVDGAMTSQGVPIRTEGIANIKVKNEDSCIFAAIEQFNVGGEQRTVLTIKETATNMLEGKLREIVSRQTVEDLYKDREMVARDVQEVIASDLLEMGLEIKNFTIRDIEDDNGYLKALGAAKIAEVKKDAEIATANAQKEAKIQTSIAMREGEAARLKAETEIAAAQKNKAVQEAEYRREQDQSKAIADASYSIQQNITLKDVTSAEMDAEVLRQQRLKEVEAEKVQIEIAKELKNIELAQRKAERKKAELRETVVEPALADKEKEIADAEAEKYRKIADAEANAEAKRKEGIASAEVIKQTGMAEAEAIRLKGLAEAEAMEKKAEAYAKYNNAAMANMMIEVLPAIAEKVAQPLSQIEKVVVLEGGNGEGKSGVSSIAGNVTSVMTGLFESVKEMTGVDLKEVVKGQTYDAKVNRNIHLTATKDAKEAIETVAEPEE